MDLNQLRKQQMSSNLLLHEFINSCVFIEVGTVNAVYQDGKRIDVLLPYKRPDNQNDVITGVELLQLGGTTAQVFIEPQVGDAVIVFNPHSSTVDLLPNAKPSGEYTGNYSPMGYKALLVNGTSEVAVTIKKDGKIAINSNTDITVTSKGKVTINGHLEVGASSA